MFADTTLVPYLLRVPLSNSFVRDIKQSAPASCDDCQLSCVVLSLNIVIFNRVYFTCYRPTYREIFAEYLTHIY